MYKINDVKVKNRIPISLGYCELNLSKEIGDKGLKAIKEIVAK